MNGRSMACAAALTLLGCGSIMTKPADRSVRRPLHEAASHTAVPSAVPAPSVNPVDDTSAPALAYVLPSGAHLRALVRPGHLVTVIDVALPMDADPASSLAWAHVVFRRSSFGEHTAAERLGKLGASVYIYAAREAVHFQVQVLSMHAQQAVAEVLRTLRYPTFDEHAVDVLCEPLRVDAAPDPSRLAACGDSGSWSAVCKETGARAERLRRHGATLMHPERLAIAVVGEFDERQIGRAIETALAGLPRAPSKPVASKCEHLPGRLLAERVRREEQADFTLAWTLPAGADRAAALVALELLRERMTQRLRGTLGITYSATTERLDGIGDTMLLLHIDVRATHIARASRNVFDVLERLGEDPVPPESLTAARRVLRELSPEKLTSDSLAAYQLAELTVLGREIDPGSGAEVSEARVRAIAPAFAPSKMQALYAGRAGGRPAIPDFAAHEIASRFDTHAVDAIVARERWRFALCYDSALDIDPNAQGEVRVLVTLASDGRVQSAKASKTTAPPALAECVTTAFLRMRFGAPEVEGHFFTVPVVLAPTPPPR